jgi:hypothetical protein
MEAAADRIAEPLALEAKAAAGAGRREQAGPDEERAEERDPQHRVRGQQSRRHAPCIGLERAGLERLGERLDSTLPCAVRIRRVSWLYIALLACAVVVLVAAEWPRLAERAGFQARERRRRGRRKASLKLLKTETDEFAASVQRDLERLPTIEERDSRR